MDTESVGLIGQFTWCSAVVPSPTRRPAVCILHFLRQTPASFSSPSSSLLPLIIHPRTPALAGTPITTLQPPQTVGSDTCFPRKERSYRAINSRHVKLSKPDGMEVEWDAMAAAIPLIGLLPRPRRGSAANGRHGELGGPLGWASADASKPSGSA